jgi:hypothetical protein
MANAKSESDAIIERITRNPQAKDRWFKKAWLVHTLEEYAWRAAEPRLKRCEDFMAGSIFSWFQAVRAYGGIESHGGQNQNLRPRFYAGDQVLMGAIGRKKRRAYYG